MKTAVKMKRARNLNNSYEIDIGKEFKDVKDSIAVLAEKIHNQTTEFEKQLTKLNNNMESVLSQIADHEARLSTLEQKQVRDDERSKTIDTFKGYGKKIIYGFVWFIIILGAANGIKPFLKIFNLFAQ